MSKRPNTGQLLIERCVSVEQLRLFLALNSGAYFCLTAKNRKLSPALASYLERLSKLMLVVAATAQYCSIHMSGEALAAGIRRQRTDG